MIRVYYHAAADKSQAKAIAHALLNAALGHARIAYDSLGKPYLPDTKRLFISLTYSSGMAAAAVSQANLGVDAEKREDVSWTRIEAYLKYFGCGVLGKIPQHAPKKLYMRTHLCGAYAISICARWPRPVQWIAADIGGQG